jgi:hypothetical protein
VVSSSTTPRQPTLLAMQDRARIGREPSGELC